MGDLCFNDGTMEPLSLYQHFGLTSPRERLIWVLLVNTFLSWLITPKVQPSTQGIGCCLTHTTGCKHHYYHRISIWLKICGIILNKNKKSKGLKQNRSTERGGSVVTHETRIREVPGSNPVAGQLG